MWKFKRKFRKLLGLKKKDGLNTRVHGEEFHNPPKHFLVRVCEALITWFVVGIILELFGIVLVDFVQNWQEYLKTFLFVACAVAFFVFLSKRLFKLGGGVR